MFAVTQKVCLVSNFLCLLYLIVSKTLRFTRPPWEQQSNVDNKTKYPSFYRQNLKEREWVCVCVCVGERDSTVWSADICCRPLQGWNVIPSFTQRALALAAGTRRPLYALLHGGNRRTKSSFYRPVTLIKTTKCFLHTSMPERWPVGALMEVEASELCETGGKLLQHCIMCLAQWVQYVSGSPLIVVSVLQQTYHTLRGYTSGVCQQ